MIENIDNQLKALELKCRWPVETLLAGEYRSIFKGKGIEFEDVRPYAPGDDVRAMDWKVTARTGEPHIKRFIEEREQTIYLLVDVSESMIHDEGSKGRKTLVELGALLTLAAIKNQDRVGVILFSEGVQTLIPPAKGRTHALRVMETLMQYRPSQQGTDLKQSLERFGQIAQKHSIVFIISDFFDLDYALELQTCAYQHDVNALCLRKAPFKQIISSSLVRMEDAEKGTQQVVDLAEHTRNAHEERSGLEKHLGECGAHFLSIESDDDCVAALDGFFRSRHEGHQTGAAF